LERYNRRLNSKFPNAHPSIIQLVSTIKEEESYFSQYIRSIQTGVQYLEDPPEYFFPSCELFREWLSNKNKNQDKNLIDISQSFSKFDFSENLPSSISGFYNYNYMHEASSFNLSDTQSNTREVSFHSPLAEDSGKEEFCSALSDIFENRQTNRNEVMTDLEMKAYILEPRKTRVKILRSFLCSREISSNHLKKAALIEEVQRYLNYAETYD
jgi:hypothetical protein